MQESEGRRSWLTLQGLKTIENDMHPLTMLVVNYTYAVVTKMAFGFVIGMQSKYKTVLSVLHH